jgi:uncharacterized protein (UPF0305 family)
MSNAVQYTNTIVGSKINWYEVYILVNHWRSDLQFYKEDIRFLQQLIQKYLIWITKKENLERVADIRKKEYELALEGEKLQEKTTDHLAQVADFIEGTNKISKEEFLVRHGELEKEMSDFVKNFREKRKEVFKVTEYVMDSEDLQNILHS